MLSARACRSEKRGSSHSIARAATFAGACATSATRYYTSNTSQFSDTTYAAHSAARATAATDSDSDAPVKPKPNADATTATTTTATRSSSNPTSITFANKRRRFQYSFIATIHFAKYLECFVEPIELV